jgi:hypothetical protein
MNNQKDTQKTSLNSYGQSNVPDVNSLGDNHVYEFANKKTEKLVTALYMVTDCMETDDALKGKLRELGVELLSDMYKLATLSPVDKHVHISASLSHIDELLSFVEIACTIGFISEMNTSILKKEFLILIENLENNKKNGKHFTFTLDEKLFSIPLLEENNSSLNQSKDSENLLKDKRTSLNKLSLMNAKIESSMSHISHGKNHTFSVSEKQDRTARILSITKDKDVSIKDISNSFTDCSEKTIQRELNSLVTKGQIKKTGSKRWSRYQAIAK